MIWRSQATSKKCRTVETAVNRMNKVEDTHKAICPAIIATEQPKNSAIPNSPDIRSDTAREARMVLLKVCKRSLRRIKERTILFKMTISVETTIKGPCTVQENLPSQADRTLLSSELLKVKELPLTRDESLKFPSPRKSISSPLA